jgi:hypothetical protein
VRFVVPPIEEADRIPHERAVWRDYDTADAPVQFDGAPAPGTGGKQVCVDHGDGQIVQGYGDSICWKGVRQWRFGWPPRR